MLHIVHSAFLGNCAIYGVVLDISYVTFVMVGRMFDDWLNDGRYWTHCTESVLLMKNADEVFLWYIYSFVLFVIHRVQLGTHNLHISC